MFSQLVSDLARQALTGLRLLVVLTVVLGIGYPAAVWAVGRVALDDQAQGSLVSYDGELVGSSLLGQRTPGDQWFHPRPSAGGYDPLASGPSNLGPSATTLLTAIEKRRAAVAESEGVDPAAVPPDAVTASASGLDPSISRAYAELQVARVARVNALTVETVEALVDDHTTGRSLGFLGEPTVDVLPLNIAVAEAR